LGFPTLGFLNAIVLEFWNLGFLNLGFLNDEEKTMEPGKPSGV
jgi:hypothetical protein